MKKYMLALIAVTIIGVMFSFSACKKTEPVPVEQAVSTEQEIADGSENTEEPSAAEDSIPSIEYTADHNYVLLEDCKVYDSASDSARLKKRDDLTEDAKNHAAPGNDAILMKGTVVTCLEPDGDWMRIPSGWICCRDENRLYVSDQIVLTDEDIKEKGSNSPYTIYDIDGSLLCDGGEMIAADYVPKGTYTMMKRNNEEGTVSFNGDGTCAVKYSEPVDLYTDEDGNWDGCTYTVKDDIVYIRNGGSSAISAYEMFSGNTLEFAYRSSSTKTISFD